jgi:hypothetical protein
MYAQSLPTYEDPSEPLYRLYADFMQVTSAELYNRITDFIHSQNSAVGILQWSAEGTDLQRKESNSGYHVLARICMQPVRISQAPEHGRSGSTQHSRPFIDFSGAAVSLPHRGDRTIATAGSLLL